MALLVITIINMKNINAGYDHLAEKRVKKKYMSYKPIIFASTICTSIIVIIFSVNGNHIGWMSAYGQNLDANDQTFSPPDLFSKAEKSVVQITATNLSPDQGIMSGNDGQASVLGSGFVYDNQGHIITNNHVISISSNVEVTFIDGNVYSAKVVGKDPYADLAVLQLDQVALNEEKIIPLSFANSSLLRVGEPIAVIGNPFGLSGSMTTGIVSQEDRLLPEEDSGYSIPGTIQIDAAVNPGNSGGPLLNFRGEVVGVTTAIYSNTGTFSGVGFAIPSNTIQRIVPRLITHGDFQHPWLGIGGMDITPSIAKMLGLRDARGVIILSIAPGSPADLAGLNAGKQDYTVGDSAIKHNSDIIIGIDEKQVRKMQDIITYIDAKSVGDSISLQIDREGSLNKIDLTLAARPNTKTS